MTNVGYPGYPSSAMDNQSSTNSTMEKAKLVEKETRAPTITFTDKDTEEIIPHQDEHVVISLTTAGDWIDRVLVDGVSSANVIFRPCFEALEISKDLHQQFHGTLVGFSGGQVVVRGYIDL